MSDLKVMVLEDKCNRQYETIVKLQDEKIDLFKENQQLKEKINTYENPEDLTLMFMYCNEKAKDKIKELQATNESLTSLVNSCQKEIRQLKAENHRLEYNEKILLKREETAINYINQVIGYKSCASEIDEELNTLIGILRGGNNE